MTRPEVLPKKNAIDFTHDLAFDLEYAHCTRASLGKPDKAPYSAYELRSVRAVMFRVPGNWAIPEETFECHTQAGVIGYGDDKAKARHDARYKLMDQSRTTAEKADGKDQVGA